ncbi:MAG TPA: hypothetical protein VGD72_03240 [Mycobacteriales bacterium]
MSATHAPTSPPLRGWTGTDTVAGRAARRVPAPRGLGGIRIPAGWPLVVLLAGYPVWWALGLTEFAFIGSAVPMAVQLTRRGRLRFPPGFGLWALLLVWVVLGAVMLGVTAPGTMPPTGSGKLAAFALRVLQYVAITVIMLWAGTMSEREVPRRFVVSLLGVLFLWTVAGGLLGALYPQAGFATPLSHVLPRALLDNAFVGRNTTVKFAQVHEVLGGISRPAAPYLYTNTWGYCYSLLLPWFAVGWIVRASPPRRLFALAVVAVSLYPVVYSLNRGLWIGLGLSVAYLGARFAVRGRLTLVALVSVVVLVLAAVFALSPLRTVVGYRLHNPHSNETRSYQNGVAFRAALRSPVLGYGGTRQTVGNDRSIALGATDNCPQCGNRDVGSTGQLWNLLLQNGFVGAFCYIAFFLAVAWRYRRDFTAIGMAGGLTVLLPLFYMLVYPAIGMPLTVSLVAVGLLWRNDLARRAAP